MAFNAGAVRGTLELNAKDFIAALDRANKALDRIDRNAKQTAKGFTNFRNKLSLVRDAIIVLPVAMRALKAPFDMIKGAVKSVTGEFIEFEQQIRDFSTAIAFAGSQDVSGFTQSFRDFASEIQRTTKFSDGMVLEVGKTLSVLGVQEDQLMDATKAVLDYSAATGREAVQSAINFGKTLGGVIGELGEAFPQVKELSVEALKMGKAFDVAREVMGGFSEESAKTLGGSLEQLKNLFIDLQKAVGEELAPVFVEATKAISEGLIRAVEIVKNNGELIRETFKTIGAAVLDALAFIIRAFGQIGEIMIPLIAQGQQFGALLSGALGIVKISVIDLEIAWLHFTGVFRGFSQEWLADLREARTNLVLAKIEVLKTGVEYNKLAAKADQAAQAGRVFAATADEIADGLNRGATAMRNINVETGAATQKAAQLEGRMKSTAKSTEDWLKHLREVNGTGFQTVTTEAERAMRGYTDAAGQAIDATQQIASNMENAAGSAQRAATSSASIGAGGGGGGGGGGGNGFLLGDDFGFGRSSGGSMGLDLSTIQGAQASLDAVRKSINRSVGGPFSKFARRSARGVADAIEAKLKGMTDAAFADFTSGLLDELNRQGVFDPVARQKFIDERIQEAVRLGVLPSRKSTGGVFR